MTKTNADKWHDIGCGLGTPAILRQGSKTTINDKLSTMPKIYHNSDILAIDASMKRCGAALLGPSGTVWHVESFPIVEAGERIKYILENHVKSERLIVVREAVKNRWRRAAVSRSASKSMEDLIRRLLPRRCRVIVVDPQEWQRERLSGLPGDTKRQSLERCMLDGIDVNNDDEADAVQIGKWFAGRLRKGRCDGDRPVKI